jgi:hypothetical protein
VLTLRPDRRPARARRGAALLLLAAPLLASCRAAIDAYDPDAAVARDAASQVASSVQFRFDSPARDPRYEHARMRLARYALAPSKLVDDTIWSSNRGSERLLIARGQRVGTIYKLSAAAQVAPPARVGESRHFVSLDTLPDGDWRWITQVDHAIGSASPQAIGAVFSALLRSAERPAASVRADYRTTMPRTTSAFGRLATLDSVRTVRLADGSTVATIGVRLHPDRIASTFPDFAKYLRKYVSPARFRFALRDRAEPGVHGNDTWFVAEGDDDLILLRFRSRDGRLQPFDGPLRDRPDTLALHVDASVKFGPFTVGVESLRGRFVFVRTPTETGWDMRFDQEPEWDLPPIAGRMVRGPLRRPFQGEGVFARLSVQRLANGQSVIHRRTVVDVHESAIVRWIGNLGFTAMDDFAGRVEQEEARFLAEAMRAMRQDVSTLP